MAKHRRRHSRRFFEKKKRGTLTNEWRKGLSVEVKRFYKERGLPITEDHE
jgi:hypothetical protein